MGNRAATTALVEQDDMIHLRVEELPVPAFASGTRSTMHEYHRQALAVSAFLDFEPVPAGYRQGMRGIGFYGIEQLGHGGSIP
jgi:hypothetical protein